MSHPAVSHQTVRLGRGRHHEPGEEVCVMELASMLAGESFSDHPLSVCPVIGAFLRTYNDRLDDRRRQDLYAYASLVVGTRGDAAVQSARAERCLAFAFERAEERRRGLRRLTVRRPRGSSARAEGAGVAAGRSVAIDDRTHRLALGLLDELVALRSSGAGRAAGAAFRRWAGEEETPTLQEDAHRV